MEGGWPPATRLSAKQREERAHNTFFFLYHLISQRRGRDRRIVLLKPPRGFHTSTKGQKNITDVSGLGPAGQAESEVGGTFLCEEPLFESSRGFFFFLDAFFLLDLFIRYFRGDG